MTKLKTALKLSLALTTAVALCACTSIPKSTTPESRFAELDCKDLGQELAKAQETQQVATQAKSDAWKVIVPFAVGARYFHARSSLSEAQQRQAALLDAQQRKQCTGGHVAG